MADAKDLYDPKALQGEGKCEMVVFAHHTHVIQRFERPMLFVAYEPANVGSLVNELLKAAKEAGGEVIINMPRRKISREKRNALVTRALHVYRSMTEKNRHPADVAKHVVDSVLSAIE
jgi:hypothetical protein